MVEVSAPPGNAKVQVPLEAPENDAGRKIGTAEPKVAPFHQFVETTTSATATLTPAPAMPDSYWRDALYSGFWSAKKRSSAVPRIVTAAELTKAPVFGHSTALSGVLRSTMKL